MKDVSVHLIHGDCLEKMVEMDADSVDAIITDPPYGIAYRSNSRRVRFAAITNDNAPMAEWLLEAARVLKSTGSLVCFTRWDVGEDFRRAIESASLAVRNQLIWYKGGGSMGNLKASFSVQHEMAWFATGSSFTFPAKRPLSVIECAKAPSSRMVHPTEKPLGLMSYLVTALTRSEDSVLDPFMGSGTTGVAAVQKGRNFIGIEMEAEYMEIAKMRIGHARKQRKLQLI